MADLYLATSNPEKAKELEHFISLYFPKVQRIICAHSTRAEEVGKTFADNAWIKASALSEDLNSSIRERAWILADDSGLEVEALNGAPGLHSVDYSGRYRDFPNHIEKIHSQLRQLKNNLNLRARYITSLALLHQDSRWIATGILDGRISMKPVGIGVSYDPIFIPNNEPDTTNETTLAALGEEIRYQLSPRHAAFQSLVNQVKKTRHEDLF